MYKDKKQTKRWLRTLSIAKVIFEYKGYQTWYLEQIQFFIRREKIYSPKIKPELVQKLYRLAKDRSIPMTALVNKIIEDYLKRVPSASG